MIIQRRKMTQLNVTIRMARKETATRSKKTIWMTLHSFKLAVSGIRLPRVEIQRKTNALTPIRLLVKMKTVRIKLINQQELLLIQAKNLLRKR